MKPLVAPVVPAAVVAFATLVSFAGLACSDGGVIKLPADPDASFDSGGAGDGGPSGDDASTGGDATGGDTCGAAPFVEVDLVVGALSTNGSTPLAGVTVTTSICPSLSRVSDAMGNVKGRLSKSVPFYGRLQAMNYANLLTPEQKYDVDTTGVAVSMLPSLFTGLIPGFSDTASVVFIGASKDGGTGICDALDGISFTVPGHSEAVVSYYSTDSIPQVVDGATMTTASGRASIAGLAPGMTVAITGAKTGCTVETVHGVNTGRAPLEAGYVSILGAWIHGP